MEGSGPEAPRPAKSGRRRLIVAAAILLAAWQKYKGQEVMFLGVNIQDQEPDARAFPRGVRHHLPERHRPRQQDRDRVRRLGLPETFFIDRDGRITYKHVGALGWPTITAKIEEGLRGVISASEGRRDYQSTK